MKEMNNHNLSLIMLLIRVLLWMLIMQYAILLDLAVSIVVYALQNTTIDKISKMRLVGEDKGGY